MSVLLERLESFAREQDAAAEVRAYPELDLILVKSSAMPLMEQAIEAMSRDAANKAVAAAEIRAAEAAEKAAEQQAMHREATDSLEALRREAALTDAELNEKIRRVTADPAYLKNAGDLTKELEALRSAKEQIGPLDKAVPLTKDSELLSPPAAQPK